MKASSAVTVMTGLTGMAAAMSLTLGGAKAVLSDQLPSPDAEQGAITRWASTKPLVGPIFGDSGSPTSSWVAAGGFGTIAGLGLLSLPKIVRREVLAELGKKEQLEQDR